MVLKKNYLSGMSLAQDRRNVSLDVLRCLLMFGVVFQHSFAICPIDSCVLYTEFAAIFALTRPSVDGFTALSGWFGVRLRFVKLFRLCLLILFCGLVSWLIYRIFNLALYDIYLERFGIELSCPRLGWGLFRYWYLGAYIRLLFLSVLINPVIDWASTCRRTVPALCLAVFVLISYASLVWFEWNSHGTRTVVFVYVVMRFMRTLKIDHVLRRITILVIIGMLFSVMFINAQYQWGLDVGDYRNPMTVLAGIALVYFFADLHFPGDSVLVRTCSYIAPSMISVYMLHWSLLDSVLKPVPVWLVKHMCLVHPVLALLLVSIVAFILSVGLDLIRRNIVEVFARFSMTRSINDLLGLIDKGINALGVR